MLCTLLIMGEIVNCPACQAMLLMYRLNKLLLQGSSPSSKAGVGALTVLCLLIILRCDDKQPKYMFASSTRKYGRATYSSCLTSWQ